MQTNISSNLQANTEQVRPASEKYNLEYNTEVMTLDLRNRDNHL